MDAAGKLQPYWSTLWDYIEENKERAARRERLQLLARQWKDRKGLARLFGLAGWWALFGFRGLAATGSIEQRYLRWSWASALVQGVVLVMIAGFVSENAYWALARGLPFQAVTERWAYKLGKDFPLPDLVRVPEGSFMMGSEGNASAQPVHKVTFSQPFWLGQTEVTFREWDACVADNGCSYRPSDQDWGREIQPVINVSWHNVHDYVAWLGPKRGMDCRLPSEAEWEYAARAGTTTEYALPRPKGSDDITGKGLANCLDCGSQWDGKQTAPVASFSANEWRVHDMHGNVWEWVEDCSTKDYIGAPDDGRVVNDGDCVARVVRGGSWDLDRSRVRSAARDWDSPTDRDSRIGFRVVCSSPSSVTDH